MITEADIQAMADTIAEKFDPEKIILFGSYARGEATKDSDVDLLIIQDSELPRYRRAVPFYRHLRAVPVPLEIVVYTASEADDWKDVPQALISKALTEGELLYEKSA